MILQPVDKASRTKLNVMGLSLDSSYDVFYTNTTMATDDMLPVRNNNLETFSKRLNLLPLNW